MPDPVALVAVTETSNIPTFVGTPDAGKRALYEAVRENDVRTAKILLESGVVGLNDTYGELKESLPSIAAWRGNVEMLQLLIKHGADISLVDVSSRDALAGAVAIGSVDAVRVLLEAVADPNRRLPDGHSAVTRAAIHGRVEVLSLLLDHKADIDYRDNQGITPLMYAASQRREEAVRFLLERGALTYPLNAHQLSALGEAKRVADPMVRDRLVSMLKAHGAKDGDPLRPIDAALLKAVAAGDLKRTRALLADGADLHVRGKLSADFVWHRNALTAAVKYPDLCRFLIDQKINVHMDDGQGFTALHSAAELGGPETIKLLVSQGLDPNAASKNGFTPLFMAINGKVRPANVATLLELGADPNGTTFWGEPLINFASDRKYRQIVQMLKRAGAKLD